MESLGILMIGFICGAGFSYSYLVTRVGKYVLPFSKFCYSIGFDEAMRNREQHLARFEQGYTATLSALGVESAWKAYKLQGKASIEGGEPNG